MKFVLFIFSLYLAPFTINLYLSGTVRFADQMNAEKLEGLYLFVKNQGHILVGDSLNKKGEYNLTITTENWTGPLDFYYAGNRFDTTFIRSVHQFKSQLVEIDFVIENGQKK